MRTNLTNCDYQQINKETEKVLLEQLWGNSCNRAVIYCLTVITFYFLLLGGIIVYETYQVYGSFSLSDMKRVVECWRVESGGRRGEAGEHSATRQDKPGPGSEV